MIRWTPEELADMAAADEEIEASFELSTDEAKASEDLDDAAVAQRMGLTPTALRARRERVRAWSAAHPDSRRRTQRKYAEKHKAEIKAYKAAWYQANKEKILAQKRAKRQKK